MFIRCESGGEDVENFCLFYSDVFLDSALRIFTGSFGSRVSRFFSRLAVFSRYSVLSRFSSRSSFSNFNSPGFANAFELHRFLRAVFKSTLSAFACYHERCFLACCRYCVELAKVFQFLNRQFFSCHFYILLRCL
ncbi:hypothetical protein D3C81_1748520 [compost metagenome]